MNWGMIGFGAIAPKFVDNLKLAQTEKLIAIASASNSKTLGKDFPQIQLSATYQELFQNPEIDIVYISTTHNFHKQNVIEALRAGKHVLCEKPLGVSLSEVEEMVKEAQHKNKFLMEAMWTRFLPAYRHFKELLNTGILGKIKFARADFGFHSLLSEDRRLFNSELAGGALLDVGVYPLAFINDVFGKDPDQVFAKGIFTHTGVDEHIGALLQYSEGQIAEMYCSFLTKTIHDAIVCGEKGILRLKDFWHGSDIELEVDGKNESISLPMEGTGFIHEIREVIDCIRLGKIESEIMSHQHSLQNARLVDRIFSSAKPPSGS